MPKETLMTSQTHPANFSVISEPDWNFAADVALACFPKGAMRIAVFEKVCDLTEDGKHLEGNDSAQDLIVGRTIRSVIENGEKLYRQKAFEKILSVVLDGVVYTESSQPLTEVTNA